MLGRATTVLGETPRTKSTHMPSLTKQRRGLIDRSVLVDQKMSAIRRTVTPLFVRRVPKPNHCIFKSLLEEPDFRTRSGAVKVNYNILKGRYLRQAAFFSLIQCGYIGSDIETSGHFRALVEDAIDGGKALVWAVQRKTREAERKAERVRQVRLYEERLGDEF
jgi:hypothetical protein